MRSCLERQAKDSKNPSSGLTSTSSAGDRNIAHSKKSKLNIPHKSKNLRPSGIYLSSTDVDAVNALR